MSPVPSKNNDDPPNTDWAVLIVEVPTTVAVPWAAGLSSVIPGEPVEPSKPLNPINSFTLEINVSVATPLAFGRIRRFTTLIGTWFSHSIETTDGRFPFRRYFVIPEA